MPAWPTPSSWDDRGDRWRRLAAKGARLQRPLWASTGTKNPAYSDVIYLDMLIGRDRSTPFRPPRSASSRITGQWRRRSRATRPTRARAFGAAGPDRRGFRRRHPGAGGRGHREVRPSPTRHSSPPSAGSGDHHPRLLRHRRRARHQRLGPPATGGGRRSASVSTARISSSGTRDAIGTFEQGR